jgi:hypothetical protein
MDYGMTVGPGPFPSTKTNSNPKTQEFCIRNIVGCYNCIANRKSLISYSLRPKI